MPTLNVNVTINSPALTQILQNTEKLLMSAADDKQALADLAAASADVSAKVTDGITKLEALVATLQSGGTITAADLQAITAQLKGVSTQITTEEAKQGV